MRTIYFWHPLARALHVLLIIGLIVSAYLAEVSQFWHAIIGSGVGLLVVGRILEPQFGKQQDHRSRPSAGLVDLVKYLEKLVRGHRCAYRGSSPLGVWLVRNLQVSILLVVISGAGAYLDAPGVSDWLEELHEGSLIWLVLSIIVHVLAVFLESWRAGVNLFKMTFTGEQSVPDATRVLD